MQNIHLLIYSLIIAIAHNVAMKCLLVCVCVCVRKVYVTRNYMKISNAVETIYTLVSNERCVDLHPLQQLVWSDFLIF